MPAIRKQSEMNSQSLALYFKNYMWMWGGACISQNVFRSKRTTFRIWYSSSTTQILGTEFRTSGLVSSTFTHWTNFPSHFCLFIQSEILPPQWYSPHPGGVFLFCQISLWNLLCRYTPKCVSMVIPIQSCWYWRQSITRFFSCGVICVEIIVHRYSFMGEEK